MKDSTLIVKLIDASGSMSVRSEEIRKSVQDSINEHANTPGEAVLAMYTFATRLNKEIDFVDVKKVDGFKYECGGNTALYDAIGNSIDEVGFYLNALPEDERPSKVIFMIITDGEENASRFFNQHSIKAKIEHQTQKYSWAFTYLGSNQDAILAGGVMGISKGLCATYSDANLSSTFASMSGKLAKSRGVSSMSLSASLNFSDSERESYLKT